MLTNKRCETAPIKDKPYKLTHGHGLNLRVMPAGSKYWKLR